MTNGALRDRSSSRSSSCSGHPRLHLFEPRPLTAHDTAEWMPQNDDDIGDDIDELSLSLDNDALPALLLQ